MKRELDAGWKKKTYDLPSDSANDEDQWSEMKKTEIS